MSVGNLYRFCRRKPVHFDTSMHVSTKNTKKEAEFSYAKNDDYDDVFYNQNDKINEYKEWLKK